MPLLLWHSSILKPPKIPQCFPHNVLIHSPGVQGPTFPSEIDHSHHHSAQDRAALPTRFPAL